jgi:hypothetical protein
MLLMFIPIGIVIDVSEKDNKMIKQPVFGNCYFIIILRFILPISFLYFCFYPLFGLSKPNTEIIAI